MAEDRIADLDVNARENALREVLDVISRSRDNEMPVFDAILRNAARFCDATQADLDLVDADGRHLREVATWGDGARAIPSEYWVWPMDSDYEIVDAVRNAKVSHTPDLRETEKYRAGNPMTRAAVDSEGMRTILIIPLVSQTEGIGCIVLFRQVVKPFSAEEIALIETFAAQAVIAIENVRQFREVQTRLEREEASREILQVISASRTDPAPVFDVILRNATHLSGAPLANLCLVNDVRSHWTLVAHFGDGLRHLSVGTTPRALESDLVPAVAMRTAQVVHIQDLTDTELYRQGDPGRVAMVEEEGMRTILCVPLLTDAGAIGCITLFRREVKPFGGDEIALVEGFAAQAVIAIENVRQFREVQDRLEREAASREILDIISRSQDDDAPVFDAVLRQAATLCGAPMASLNIVDEDRKIGRLVAHWGDDLRLIEVGKTTWNLEFDRDDEFFTEVSMRDGVVRQCHDLKDTDRYRAGNPHRREMVDVEGIRTFLAVPLIRQGQPIGNIALYRREVQPFTDDQIALVETFAAQAVIAIENIRQFREVQTRLEREAATKQVLQVISQSREDDLPVFKTITQAVSRLCNAPLAYICLLNEARTHVTIPAQIGARPDFAERLARFCEPVENNWLMAVSATLERQVIRVDDLAQDELYLQGNEYRVNMVDEEGMRSVLAVPLISGDQGVGCIFLYRRDVAPFTDAEVELVRGFAAQAVIAIENVRQFRELQQRLEQEKASGEILQVISQSRDDDQRVFDTLLEKAVSLSQSAHGSVWLVNADGVWLETVARNDTQAAQASGFDRRRMDATDSAVVDCVRERSVWRMDDLQAQPGYDDPDFPNRAWMSRTGARSMLLVPLVSGDVGIGLLAMYRSEIKPYTQEDVTMIEGFASQAVIAIENTRQFKALETLNAELGDRVEAQVGELERMGKLKRFLPEQVADAVVSSGDDSLLSSHRALISALFCDIRGFTAFCETAEPEETIEVLQAYHEEMGKLIADHGAGVDHRAGDGIMVLFNDPLPCDDPAGDAVRLAFAMRATMEGLCKRWRKLGHRLGFGVGISLGYATVGMVGSEGRFHYTASGTAVNLAARLCDMAGDGEILLSPRARIAVEDEVDTERMGEVEIKGISAPVEVWRAVAARA